MADKVKFPFSGLAFAAVALTRPEGAMFFFATAIFVLALWKLKGRKPTRKDILWAALFLIPFVVHLLWRYSYYGYWLPNTYYVKTGAPLTGCVIQGAKHIGGFVLHYGPLLSFCCVVFSLLAIWRLCNKKLLLAIFVAAQVLFVLKVGGDRMMSSRFVVPVVPILCVMSALVLVRLVTILTTTLRIPALLLALLFVAFVGSFRLGDIVQNAKDVWTPWAQSLQAHRYIGRWLKKNSHTDNIVALGDVGLIPYISDLRVIDMMALTNEYFAHLPGKWEDKVDVEWVMAQKPDFIVLVSFACVQQSRFAKNSLPPIETKIVSHPQFTAHYRFVLQRQAGNRWLSLWQHVWKEGDSQQ